MPYRDFVSSIFWLSSTGVESRMRNRWVYAVIDRCKASCFAITSFSAKLTHRNQRIKATNHCPPHKHTQSDTYLKSGHLLPLALPLSSSTINFALIRSPLGVRIHSLYPTPSGTPLTPS